MDVEFGKEDKHTSDSLLTEEDEEGVFVSTAGAAQPSAAIVSVRPSLQLGHASTREQAVTADLCLRVQRCTIQATGKLMGNFILQ